MSVDYYKFRYPDGTLEGAPIKVDAANEDGACNNIQDTYAKQNGYYDGLGAGIADVAKSIDSDREIEDAAIACPPIVFGAAGNTAEIQSGYDTLEYLEGNTESWNQYINYKTDTFTQYDVTFTRSGNGWVANGTASESKSISGSYFYDSIGTSPTAIATIVGHKYLMGIYTNDENLKSYEYINNDYSSRVSGFYIKTQAASDNPRFELRVTVESGAVYNNSYFSMMLVDLTLIYGIGNEPTTVSQFKSKYPLDYYPYSAPILLSSKSNSLISVEKNQYSGLNTFIRVLPGVEYELSGITAGGYVQEYDASQNLIKTSSEITATTDITLDANTYYVKILATTYSDIMFYVAYETYGETYEPYESHTLQLPNLELRSAGRGISITRDIAYQTGGGLRKVKALDLGSMGWSVYNADKHIFASNLSDMVNPNSYSIPSTISCDSYSVIKTPTGAPATSLTSDKSIGQLNSGTIIYVRNDSCSTGAEIKAALSGVTLYYPLTEANYTEITVDENPGWNRNLKIDNYGTLQFTTSPQQVPQVPQAYFIKYTVSLVEFLDSSYVKTGGDGNNIALQSDMDKVESDIQEIQNGQIIAGKSLTTKAIENVSEESGTVQETPFINQGTGTNNNIESVDTSPVGKQLEKQGNTIVYNQLVQNGDFANGTSGWFVTYGTMSVSNKELTYTVNQIGTIGQPVNRITQASVVMTQSHKYLLRFMVNCPYSAEIRFVQYSSQITATVVNVAKIATSGWNDFYAIVNYTAESVPADFRLCVIMTDSSQVGDVFKFKQVSYIDLTQWFNGNENIPQDLLDYPEHFSWYYNGDLSYNIGEINNCAGRYLECGQSRNIYNPEETYNRVIPNIEYYYYSKSATATTITYYDKDKNVISTASVSSGNTFTTPSNCMYINSSETSNITISLYYSTGEGYDEYYPYVAPIVYDTGTEVLRKAGGVKDTKAPDGIITRRIGQVDLGSLTWSKYEQGTSTGHYGYYASASAYQFKATGFETPTNIICSRYLRGAFANTRSYVYGPSYNIGSCIALYDNNNHFYIYDSEFDTAEATAAQLKTALSGVIAYVELATPTTEQGTAFSENIQINDYGDMGWLDTNEDLVSIPQGAKLFYPADYVLLIDSLNSYTNGDVTSLAKKSDLVNKQDKLTQSTDLTPTTQTLTLVANTRYALGTLTTLGLTFPASGNDGDEIIIEFVSGSTATTLILDNVNAIYNFNSINADKFVELNAQYKVSIGKWVVYSAETDYTVV